MPQIPRSSTSLLRIERSAADQKSDDTPLKCLWAALSGLGRDMSPVSSIRHRFAAALLAALMAFAGVSARAMDITTTVGVDGRRIVVAQGTIGAGDTERLRRALAKADPGRDGLRSIALDSPGGAVDEALDMALLMDRERVAVTVEPGAVCASACAQIVFFAGVERVVQEGGRLGLHSCSRAGASTRVPICNEMIAQQAAARGAPYGTLMAFMQMTAPGQMRWLDAEDADCWGLTLWPAGSNRGIRRGDLPPCIQHDVRMHRSASRR